MKKLTIRKDRQCDYCFDKMPVGSSAYVEKGRIAKYDYNDKQVGIEYYKNYACLTCHYEMTERIFTYNGNSYDY